MTESNFLQRAREHLAGADVYLLDLILSGRLTPPRHLLDAGCGSGRNLAVLGGLGFSCVGLDYTLPRLREARVRAAGLGEPGPLCAGDLGKLPFRDSAFEGIVANAVLHFAPDSAGFEAMFSELWRVLSPGGLFFARLAVLDGVEGAVRPAGDGWYALPDGSERFLTSLAWLELQTRKLGAEYVTPLKTAHVYGARSMATWCIRKPVISVQHGGVL